MKFSLATAALLVSGVAAQLPANIPADVRSYADSLSSNPAALQALVGIFTASQVQQAVLAAQTLSGVAVIQTFQAAVQQAIAAEPTSLQSLASSVVNQIAPLALTDGLLGGASGAATSVAASATGAVGSAARNATSSAAGALSSASAASNGTLASASSGAVSSASRAASASASSGSAASVASTSRAASGTTAGTAATTTAAGSNGNSLAIPAALLAGGAFVVAAL